MQLRFRPEVDVFAAASARSESLFRATCLPVPVLAQHDDCSSSTTGAEELWEATAPAAVASAEVDWQPRELFHTAMTKARKLIRPKLDAVGRLLSGGWWSASADDLQVRMALGEAEAEEASAAGELEVPILGDSVLRSTPSAPVFDAVRCAARASCAVVHEGDAARLKALRTHLGVYPLPSPIPPPHASPLHAALLLTVTELTSDSCEGDDADIAMPLCRGEQMVSCAAPSCPAAAVSLEPSLLTQLLSLPGAAAVAAHSSDDDASPEEAERCAANADPPQHACAALRAVSFHLDAHTAALIEQDGHEQRRGLDALVVDAAEDAILLDDAADARAAPPVGQQQVFTLEPPELPSFPGDLAAARAQTFDALLAQAPACEVPAVQEGEHAALPPSGAACASCARGCADDEAMRCALTHAMVSAPGLVLPADVPCFPLPLTRNAPGPSAADLLCAAARGTPRASAAQLAGAELALPWGADCLPARTPTAAALRRAVSRPQALPGTSDAVAGPPAPSMLEVMEGALEIEVPVDEQRPQSPMKPAAAAPRLLLAPPASVAAGGTSKPAPQRGARPESELAFFVRSKQAAASVGAAVTAAPPPPPMETLFHLPPTPHARCWRLLRAAACNIAAVELARHSPRDASLLLDSLRPGGSPLDVASLQAHIRSVASTAEEAHVAALACIYVLHSAAAALLGCGARVGAAYLSHALRTMPQLASGALGAATAPAAEALESLAACVGASDEGQEADHPKLRALRQLLSAMDALSPGAKAIVVSDSRAFFTIHAAVAATSLRAHQLDREGAHGAAGASQELDAKAAAAMLTCDVLMVTHEQLQACGEALRRGRVGTLVVYTPPQEGAFANSPPFAGAVHVFTMREPAPIGDTGCKRASTLEMQPEAMPPPPPLELPAMAMQEQVVHAPTAVARQQHAPTEESPFARLLLALSPQSEWLRAQPSLRDALLRLEGRVGASVAERCLSSGTLGLLDGAPMPVSAHALLACPDAAAMGCDGGVWALRMLRSADELGALAGVAATQPALLASLLRAWAHTYGGGLVLVAALPGGAGGEQQQRRRNVALGAACLVGACASAAVPLRIALCCSEADARDAALAALMALAQPAGSPPRLVPLPDKPDPAENLLCRCPGVGPLTAHALLCGGVSLSALLRSDSLPDAAALAAAAARGGATLAPAVAAVLHAWRTASLPQPPPQPQPPQAPAWGQEEPAPWTYAPLPLPPPQQAAPHPQHAYYPVPAPQQQHLRAMAGDPGGPGGLDEFDGDPEMRALLEEQPPFGRPPPLQYGYAGGGQAHPRYAPPAMERRGAPPSSYVQAGPAAAASRLYGDTAHSSRGVGVGVGAMRAPAATTPTEDLLESWVLKRRRQQGGAPVAGGAFRARSCDSSGGSDDTRRFLEEMERDAAAPLSSRRGLRPPPPLQQQQRQPQPQASRFSSSPPPPGFARSRAPPPPPERPRRGSGSVLNAFRYGGGVDEGGAGGGGNAAPKRMRLAQAPLTSAIDERGAPPPLHSPAGSESYAPPRVSPFSPGRAVAPGAGVRSTLLQPGQKDKLNSIIGKLKGQGGAGRGRR